MSKRIGLNFVASEGRFADLGVEQIENHEAEDCELACAPRYYPEPEGGWVEGTRRGTCFKCEQVVALHPKDPVKPLKICEKCLVAMMRGGGEGG